MLSNVCLCVCVYIGQAAWTIHILCVWLRNHLTNEAKGKVKKSDRPSEQREGPIPYRFSRQSEAEAGRCLLDSVLYIERVI